MDLVTLERVFPDINITDPEFRKIMQLDVDSEIKVTNILSHYFKRKNLYGIKELPLNADAYCIKTLFPSCPMLYILEQLEIFRDMPSRKEIVLRIIVNKKMPDCELIPNVKRSSSNTEPAQQCSDYNYQPVKIRKLTAGPAVVCKVTEANNECWMPKPLVKAKFVAQSHMNDLLKSVHNLETEEGTPITDAFKVPQHDHQNLSFTRGRIIEEIINTGDSVENEKGVLNLNIIGDDELPVADICTITSSVQEPIEKSLISSDSEVISECSKKAIFTTEDQEEPSTSFPDNRIEKNAYSVAQKCTVTSNGVGVNSMEELNQDVDLNLLPNFDYPNDDVNKSSVIMQSENADHGGSVLDKIVINEKLLPSFGEDEKRNMVSLVTDPSHMPRKNETFSSTVSECQEVPSVVYSSSTVRIQEKQNLKPTNATNSFQMQDCGPEIFNLLEYLREITNAPLNVIQKKCRQLNISTSTRPDPVLLEMVIDNLLTNKISSESSDDEEIETVVLDDELPIPMQDVSTPIPKNEKGRYFFTVRSPPPLPKKRITSKLASFINVHPDVSIKLVKKKTNCVKPIAPATVTNQRQLDQQGSDQLNKTIGSITITDIRSTIPSLINNQLVNYLCGIFPDASPDYIRELCKDKSMNNEVLDELTTVILNTNYTYPKRPPVSMEPDVFPENQLDILKEFLPDADPDYLRMMCDKFESKPDKVKTFINEAMELRNYPTMKDYQRRQQLSAQQRQYTTEFNVENFIKLIPDPHAFFSDPQRTIKMDSLSSHYALVFLRNTFNKLPIRTIQSTFTKHDCKLYHTVKELEQITTEKRFTMKSTRKPMEMPNNIQNIPLLQEIAYFTHENEINNYLQGIKDKEEAERKEALSNGLFKTCSCCYDEEVLPKEMFCCENGCSFCKSCIMKSTEVRFSDGKLDFPCLMNCSSHFTLQTLQTVLSPKLFSKIAQKKALEEIKSAGIEELEMCPFCDFATIPAEGYNIFSCLNPECMKESCRLCKEPSHIPLRCEEIEKDEEVKARTFVENKMTEALLRKCWKCGIKFFKEEGCNKMTCSCGAMMCYICGSPVTDYKHFNGDGGDRFDLCPLYSDTNVLNKENVLKGAAQAKAEIGNKTLKHDPTTDIHQHYKERATNIPQQRLLGNHQERVMRP